MLPPLQKQFDRLRSLKDGWLEPESKPLDRLMLERFESHLSLVEKEVGCPHMYPTAESEARAEWSWGLWEASLTTSLVDQTYLLEAFNVDTRQNAEHVVSSVDEIVAILRSVREMAGA